MRVGVEAKMIITSPQLKKTIAEERFAFWLTTQRSANGKLFKPFVANGYARNLRTEPPKLDIPLSLAERDVFIPVYRDIYQRC